MRAPQLAAGTVGEGEVVAVGNHKGGVTKTTTTINIGVGLALAGWHVLIVDCDAQANTTSILMPQDGDEIDVEHDFYDVITGAVEITEAIVSTRIPGLDLLPSSLAVARLDQELIAMHKREEQIKRHLRPVRGNYDIIMLDLPPNLGAVVIAGLCAASLILIATDATKWGRDGAIDFVDWLTQLREADVVDAEILGVLISKFQPQELASKKTLAALQDTGLPLLNTLIPRRTGADKMTEERFVIGDPEADPDISRSYAEAVVEVIERVQAAQEQRGRHARAE